MLQRKYIASVCIVGFLVLLSGCKQTPNTVAQPIDNQASSTSTDAAENQVVLPSSIAILPFANSTENRDAADMLRRALHGHLARTNYDFPHINDIDNRLALLDPNQSISLDESKVITDLLGVDALLFGNVLNYDTIYAGLYAQISFEVEMMLISRDGSLIWQETFEEVSREGGISASAWGLLYSLAVTAMHLDDENLYAVADKLGRNIATKIPQPEGYQQTRYSYIESVIHDGANKPLRYGDTLKVGIKGEANKRASVKLQGVDQVFDLQETEPGVYLADIPIAVDWESDGMMVTGYLHSSSGYTSKAISPAGLIKVDNTAPSPIENLSISTSPDTVSLSWKHPESQMTYKVFKKTAVGLQLLGITQNNSILVEHKASPFDTLELTVIAIDAAGNESIARDTSQPVYPMASLYEAVSLAERRLPSILDGQILMRKQDGPFLIDRQIILAPGSSLFIEPGTVLEFASTGNLLVQGSVFTFGGEKIQLRPVSNQLTAQAFLTLDSSEHVQLDGVSIHRAGIAVEILKGKALLSNCELINSQYSALVATRTAVLTVESCLIDGSNTSAIVVTDQARLKINQSHLINNMPFHIQSASVFEIDATSNTWIPEASPMTVLGNVRYSE